MPVVGTPSIWPVSSKETSDVGGSMERTRLTNLLPLDSPICSPNMGTPHLSFGFRWLFPGWAILYLWLKGGFRLTGGRCNRVDPSEMLGVGFSTSTLAMRARRVLTQLEGGGVLT